jgi:outer membrane protein insertion porin family
VLKNLFIVLTIIVLFGSNIYAENINKITISGNNRIESDYIKYLLISKEDQEYRVDVLNSDLKRLYASEYFQSVKSSFNGGVLNIEVVESPLIDNVEFIGNDEVNTETLEKEIISKKKTYYSQNKIIVDMQRIVDIYSKSGYLSASATYEVNNLDQNRVKIVINIIEGPKTTIKTINFVGNNKFSKSDLENAMLSRENKWWRFLTSTDVYDKSRIMYDGELLRQFYFENGYPNFNMVSIQSEFSLSSNQFILTYILSEGERYRFGDVVLKIQIPELEQYEDMLLENLDFPKEQWFKNSIVQKKVFELKQKINNLGYQFISVQTQNNYNDINRTVDIVFIVREEKKVFINEIEIKGNTKTKDSIIRRELKVSEQDAYTPDVITQAQRNLYRTGFFEAVNLYQTQSSDTGKINLNVDVTETSTGSISVGGGYSTVDKLQFETSYAESNLFGNGNYFSINLSLSQNTNTYSATVTDPYFLDKEISSSFSLYRTDSGANDFSDNTIYDTQEQGVSVSAGYYITNNFRQTWGYQFFYRNISNVEPGASQSIQQISGISYISKITHNISYDSTDNALYPTRGIYTNLYTEYAGLLADVYYIKNTYKIIWYQSLYEDIVFSALGSTGAIVGLRGQEVNIVDRYTLGGSTLRGFAMSSNYGGVGPVDLQTGESLGGNYMFRGSFQIETPVPGVKNYGLLVYAFNDFGTVTNFETNNPNVLDTATLRVSAGVGLSWRSPAGIISLDFGYPIRQEPTDRTEVIFLNFGTRF